MTKLKFFIAKIIRKVCCISPDAGNKVMDIIGYENYCKITKYWR